MSTMATQVPTRTPSRQTGPGEHAGENWRSSERGVEGVLSPGVAKQGVEIRLAAGRPHQQCPRPNLRRAELSDPVVPPIAKGRVVKPVEFEGSGAGHARRVRRVAFRVQPQEVVLADDREVGFLGEGDTSHELLRTRLLQIIV
jgi:hypothetical protein